MSSELAITVRGLGKRYLIYDKPSNRLLQMLFRGRRTYYSEFWALRGVSFSVARGSTVGIIGRNGTGKSTLLQIICGTVDQSEGEVEVNGKVAALLELGAGFNPEFTGRENVFLSGALYGLSREEMERRFETIRLFADIGEFVERPVKTYSSGMFVRLAFAVIAHVDAEILVIDEALSVGDAYFQQKCMRYLRGFQRQGGTLLFVSHDMGAVTALCDSAIMLSRNASGRSVETGRASDIASLYLKELNGIKAEERTGGTDGVGATGAEVIGEDAPTETGERYRATGSTTRYYASAQRSDAEAYGAGGARISEVRFCDRAGEPVSEFCSGEAVRLTICVKLVRTLSLPAIGFMVKDRHGRYVVAESTDSYLRDKGIVASAGSALTATFDMELPPLVHGVYTIDVACAEGPGAESVQQHWIHDVLRLTALNERLVHGVGGLNHLVVGLEVRAGTG